jgi:hypothetical protein
LRCLAIAALMALAACSDLTTDKPIGGLSANHADPHLIGVWKLATNPQNGQAGYLFISPRKEGDGLHAVFIGWSASSQSQRLEFDATTGTAGGAMFANIDNMVASDNSIGTMPSGYMPFVYRFGADGSLLIYDHSDDGMKLIKGAVDKHRLAGKVTAKNVGGNAKVPTWDITDIHLTSDQRTIDAFFTANVKAIFTNEVDTFTPVKEK